MAKELKLLTDIKHILGWLITTVAVIGVFHVQGVHLHTTAAHIISLFGTIVVIDYAKHKTGLQ